MLQPTATGGGPPRAGVNAPRVLRLKKVKKTLAEPLRLTDEVRPQLPIPKERGKGLPCYVGGCALTCERCRCHPQTQTAAYGTAPRARISCVLHVVHTLQVSPRLGSLHACVVMRALHAVRGVARECVGAVVRTLGRTLVEYTSQTHRSHSDMVMPVSVRSHWWPTGRQAGSHSGRSAPLGGIRGPL